jgi:hypothetical protein
MNIRISKCSKITYWYSDQIGKIFRVTNAIKYPNNAGKGFEVYIKSQRKFIDVDDAEIVFEEFQ